MLQDAGLTKQLWAEAIKCANFIRNRSPVTGNDKTPLELFTGVKPDVSLMRTFGAKAYVYVPKQLRRKLDPTGEHGMGLHQVRDTMPAHQDSTLHHWQVVRVLIYCRQAQAQIEADKHNVRP
jgi:hypothetical protein